MRKKISRAWNKEKQAWFYVNLGQTITNFGQKIYDKMCVDGVEWFEYIGQSDKNKEEMFEGDIVKFKLFGEWYTAKIKYDEMHCMFFFLTKKAALNMFDMWDHKLESYPIFEIIGNTLENPELKEKLCND